MVVHVDEQQLAGGVANAGRVTRSGGHVLRPSGPYSGSVRAFLLLLREAGFEGAPLPAIRTSSACGTRWAVWSGSTAVAAGGPRDVRTSLLLSADLPEHT
jgi:hypothetical protein